MSLDTGSSTSRITCEQHQEMMAVQDRLLAIVRVNTPVLGSRPLREQIGELIAQACNAYGVEAGVLRAVQGDDLVLVAAHGIPAHQTAANLSARIGIAGRVIASRKPLAIGDVRETAATAGLAARARTDPSKFEFISYIGAPLLVNDEIIGILGMFSVARRRDFNEVEICSLQNLANHIAICMVNEQLYETLTRQREELRTEIRRRDEMERERAALEEQLRRAQRLEALGQMAGGFAHDFNNLLTVILGNTSIALRTLRLSGLPEDLCSPLLQVQAAGDRAADLTHRLLAFSQKQPTQPRVLDLCQLVRDSGPMLSRFVRAGIQLHIECDQGACMVRGDAGQFEQVLANIVLNARDAISGSGRIDVWCRPIQVQGEPWCVLGVRDTGVGMTPEVRARLFEPFFTTKSMEHGTGLGLPMVYGIVTQAGGRVVVESEPAQGTTVLVYLPSCAGQSGMPVAESAAPSTAGARRLLLCDDEPAVRCMIACVLRDAGYEVLEAADGVAALELVSSDERPVDLLVTDLVMPRMGGDELARHMFERQPALRVLFVSGCTGDCDTNAELLANASVLPKPFTLKELLTRVEQLLCAR